jgi:DNA-binding PadR family transcriptional regulator
MTRGELWFGCDPFDFAWGGHRGGRHRRRRQWFGSGDMKYVILNLIKDKPMHGYEVMKALEEQTQGCYKPSPGTVCPTLQWLDDEGLVESEEREGRKVYSITDDGRAFLEENKSSVEDIFDRLDEMIDRFMGNPMPDVTRAVGKLVSQVYRASWRLRDDTEKRQKIADVLDGAIKELDALLV